MAAEAHVVHRIDVEREARLDAGIAALAGRQYGVVGRTQLAELGVGRGAIELRLRRSAAELWAIRQSGRVRIEVSVPRHRRSTPRLELHVVEMEPNEVTVEHGIPVTTPARTLFDLAAVLTLGDLEHAFNQAETAGSPVRPRSTTSSRDIRDAGGPRT